jgi:hypothetical protein
MIISNQEAASSAQRLGRTAELNSSKKIPPKLTFLFDLCHYIDVANLEHH